MADDRNQNLNQEESRTQNPDQKNENLRTEQRTGTEMGQQERNQQGTSDWQSGDRESNLGEQSERSSSDTKSQGI